MSFAIGNGLFKLNVTDYHAILGVSLDAEPRQIRLSYLKIAQKLHPDKCRSDAQKMQMAGQILSKLVNPAYEQLSKKNNFAEHQLVLTQIGRRLAENKGKIDVNSEVARELLKAGNSAELVYAKLLKKLTAKQYKSLETVIKNIGEISELNLVYLMLKCDRVVERQPQRQVNQKPAKTTAKPQTKNSPTVTQSKTTVTQAASSQDKTKVQEPTTEARVNAFVGRAKQYISRGEFDQAVTELRDALRIDPNHATAHAVMGQAYLHKNQLTMAKVHIGKACKAEPHNPIAIESQKALNKLMKKTNKAKTSNSSSSNKSTSKSGNSGFFSGFFGSKKK